MPLPNYGYYNKEKKEHQELKFQMAPEIVDDPDDHVSAGGRKESRKRGRVNTGTLGIDLERKLVMHQEKDKNVWKPPEIDRQEVEDIKKYTSKSHQNLKREVRSALDSLISGNKVKQLQDTKEKAASTPTNGLSSLTKTSLSSSPNSSPFQSYGSGGGREITKTGVSIQPKGTFKLDSKKSLGSFSTSNNNDLGGGNSSVTRSSFSSYSMTSSSSSFKY